MTEKAKKRFIHPVVLVVVGLLVIIAVIYMNNRFAREKFCVLDDELYQAINDHIDEWKASMRAAYVAGEPFWKVLTFSVPSGNTYTLQELTEGAYTQLLVVKEDSWNERLGFRGYIYSLIGDPDLTDKYTVTHLSENIYCYQRKQGYD